MCSFFICLITFWFRFIYWTLFSFVIVILHCCVFVDTPSSTSWPGVAHLLLVVVSCCCSLSSLWIGSLTLVLSSPFFSASERKEIRNSSFKFNFFQGQFLKNKLFVFLVFFYCVCMFVCDLWACMCLDFFCCICFVC
jgi:hypothetical protein